MNRLGLIKTAYTALAALMLAACANDELTDGPVQDLPEGTYPLQIAGVSLTAESTAEPWDANAPQTRVSENTNDNSSQWDGGEEITVQLSGTKADGTSYTEEGKYTLGSDKTSLIPVRDRELYWHSTSAGTITAWYFNYVSGNTVSLSEQNHGLAYVLKAEKSNVTYNTKATLPFSHKLAKVRVMLAGDKKDDVTEVKIKTLTSCTLGTDGTLTGGSTENFIPTNVTTYKNEKCWEANVVPGHVITNVMVNGTECVLTKSLTPVVACVNTITLTVR